MPIVITTENDPTFTEGETLEADLGHVEQGLSRLIERWKADSNPNLAALLTSYLEEAQELEEAIFGVLFGRMLDYAEGVWLDALGAIVGQPRLGVSDDDTYRLQIKVRIRINRSIGTATDIIEVVKMLTGAAFDYTEGTATFWIDFTETLTPGVAAVLTDAIRDTRAAGIRGTVDMPVDQSVSPRDAFHGSDYAPTLHVAGGHSSEYDSTVGGLHGHSEVA